MITHRQRMNSKQCVQLQNLIEDTMPGVMFHERFPYLQKDMEKAFESENLRSQALIVARLQRLHDALTMDGFTHDEFESEREYKAAEALKRIYGGF